MSAYAPRYGTVNMAYISGWPQLVDDRAMWALNLMHYRERAEYADGRETTLTGWEADNLYSPLGPIAAVGAELVLVAIVVDQPAGEDYRFDRVAIVRYPNRQAFADMNAMPEFTELHSHKDAGMKFTIVAATFPQPDTVDRALAETPTSPDQQLLLQFLSDADAPDLAVPGARRIATFDVEDHMVGDERKWAQARWDLLPPSATAESVREAVAATPTGGERYVTLVKPQLGEFLAAVSRS